MATGRLCLFLCVVVLWLSGVEGTKKVDDLLEQRCKDGEERNKPACVEFCAKNPSRCLRLLNSTLIHSQFKMSTGEKLIHVTTFNVGGINPPDHLGEWVEVDQANPPDIIVIGLQEMVELTIGKMPTGFIKQDKWITALRRDIPKNYVMIESDRLIGVFLIIYMRAESGITVGDVSKHTVGTGMANFGNKGGAGISMTLNGFNLAVVNCHLAAHQDKVADRAKDFHDISRKLKFSGPAKTVFDHDAIIWLGDTNMRVNTEHAFEKVVSIIDANNHMSLFAGDQLRDQIKTGKAFVGFHELTPNFKPTFKFDVGSSKYESVKKRIPSWTDRILHWKKNDAVQIEQLTYVSRHNVVLSDHKPVQALIKVTLAGDPCRGKK